MFNNKSYKKILPPPPMWNESCISKKYAFVTSNNDDFAFQLKYNREGANYHQSILMNSFSDYKIQ